MANLVTVLNSAYYTVRSSRGTFCRDSRHVWRRAADGTRKMQKIKRRGHTLSSIDLRCCLTRGRIKFFFFLMVFQQKHDDCRKQKASFLASSLVFFTLRI